MVQQGHCLAAFPPSPGPAQVGAGSLKKVLAVSREVLPGVFHVSPPQLDGLVEQFGLGLELFCAVTWPEFLVERRERRGLTCDVLPRDVHPLEVRNKVLTIEVGVIANLLVVQVGGGANGGLPQI